MEVSFGDNSLQESEAAHERCPWKWAKLKFYVGVKQPIQSMNKLICITFTLQLYLKMNYLKAIF